MKKTKRLFLFAGYDKDGIIDDTLVYYLTELSKLGDIVLVMDCDVADKTKLKGINNLLHTELARHNEYDFGSYKRGYNWARNNKILNNYDWVYLVNDSVYGPFFDLGHVLCDLESRGVDMTGMCSSEINSFPVHIQSWFIGMSKKLANADFINRFLQNVKHQENKALIVLKYEVRMTQLVKEYGYKISVASNDKGVMIYKNPNLVLNAGVPFVKKTAMTQIYDIEFLAPYTTESFIQQIISYAKRYGMPYICRHSAYKEHFNFMLLGIPIFHVTVADSHWGTSYKVYLFKKIPLIKFVRNKRVQD
ncbi:MAG: hypothetical protein MJ170_03550 [Alphaproteobacteria bacterium]|nr:hypothetical protein [Alphaproteobacteria bacterium]